jgi:putative redox protein
MRATVSWNGDAGDETTSGMAFTAVTGSGHTLAMDGAPAEAGSPLGGRNLAPRPMEVVLAGTGGCTAYDVVLILRRGRHAVTHCEVTCEAERAPLDPKVFTAIHFHFVVTGRALKADAVERAIKLSEEKLCSASIMLAKTAVLTHSFEIREG